MHIECTQYIIKKNMKIFFKNMKHYIISNNIKNIRHHKSNKDNYKTLFTIGYIIIINYLHTFQQTEISQNIIYPLYICTIFT